jgi:hypothetical protein
MEHHHAIKNGKPSISISAIYTMAMLVITRGYFPKSLKPKQPRHALTMAPDQASFQSEAQVCSTWGIHCRIDSFIWGKGVNQEIPRVFPSHSLGNSTKKSPVKNHQGIFW